MSVPPPTSFEALLAHAGFLRSLARELSRDTSRADDLVQRTWVAALQHPPGDDQPRRRWLAAILRNFSREEHRTDQRRTDREALAARPLATSGSEALAEQIELQQSLLRAVSELDEPYRSVLFQRYYEGLAPREIAARSGVPLKTVKTQLHRGLERLRTRLDREHGDRSTWLLAFIPLTGPTSWTGPALGALLVELKLKVALVSVALLAAVGGVVYVSSPLEPPLEPPLAARVVPPSAELASVEQDELALLAPSDGTRQALEAAPLEQPATTAPVASQEVLRVRGRVLDLERRPVAGIELVERREAHVDGAQEQGSTPAERPALATSAADGTFEFRASTNGLVIQARSPGYVTVLGAQFWQRVHADKLIVVVAPRQALAGIVVDPAGDPVQGARVEIGLPTSLRADLGEVLDYSFSMTWSTSTDERGHFELQDAPGCVGELSASSPAFAKASIPLPEHSKYDLVLRLGDTTSPHLVVRGIVVDEHGAPAPQAYVALGEQTVLSASDGSFELAADIHPDSLFMVSSGDGVWNLSVDLTCVRAVKAGHLPAVHSLPPLEELRAQPDRDPIRLELGGAPLTIEGRVEDTHGKPIAGAVVWPVDGTKFGHITQDTGRESPGVPTTIEAMLRGGPSVDQVRSDENGRFVLDGLCEREYELAAFDARTMRSARFANARAGRRDAVIRLSPEADLERIGGRVVTGTGEPVAGALVMLSKRIAGDGKVCYGSTLTTDTEGRFVFQAEVLPGLRYHCFGESIFPGLDGELQPGQRLDELEIVVWLQCHLQIDLGAREGAAERFAALDASGNPTPIWNLRGPLASCGELARIADGKTEVAVVRDTCKTIVLYDEHGTEVGRVPVALKPGELNVVTW